MDIRCGLGGGRADRVGVVSTLGGSAGGVTTGEGVDGGSTGGTTLGDGGVTGATTLGVGVSVGGWVGAGAVACEKMSLSFWMAPRRTSSGVWKGVSGWGFVRASASVTAARVASSAGDEMGQAQLWGKNAIFWGCVLRVLTGCILGGSGSGTGRVRGTSR